MAAQTPYARNARKHSAAQVAQIAASIREFGFTNPVLVDDAAGVIARHGRLLAARELGLAKVPVIELAHLSETQRRAYVIADNKLALNAGWDDGLLALELGKLKSLGADLGLLGFGEGELGRLFLHEVEGEDDAPAPPAEPETRPSDLRLLGPHRLICGNATRAADVERLFAGATPK